MKREDIGNLISIQNEIGSDRLVSFVELDQNVVKSKVEVVISDLLIVFVTVVEGIDVKRFGCI